MVVPRAGASAGVGSRGVLAEKHHGGLGSRVAGSVTTHGSLPSAVSAPTLWGRWTVGGCAETTHHGLGHGSLVLSLPTGSFSPTGRCAVGMPPREPWRARGALAVEGRQRSARALASAERSDGGRSGRHRWRWTGRTANPQRPYSEPTAGGGASNLPA